jgi:hypothetical protein
MTSSTTSVGTSSSRAPACHAERAAAAVSTRAAGGRGRDLARVGARRRRGPDAREDLRLPAEAGRGHHRDHRGAGGQIDGAIEQGEVWGHGGDRWS